MTTLTINCSLHCDKLMERPPGPLVFDRVFLFAGEPEPDTEDPWSIDSARLIQINERSSVFRAELIRPNQQPEKVVLKIDPTGRREAEFITEAAAYETGAKELQGDLVPLFYGTFQTDIGNVVVTCTIIQYCGEPMEYALRDSDPDFLTQLVRVVDRLHRHGLSHGDLYERNILVKDGRPILIDLESLETHPCARRMNLLQGVLEPTVEEFGCPEMHDLILRCGAWRSDEVSFGTYQFAKSSIVSEDYLKQYMPSYGQGAVEWRKRLQEQARCIYETVLQERMITYGTHNPSECINRLDVIQ